MEYGLCTCLRRRLGRERKLARPSAQRRVGILSTWSYGQRALIFPIGPGDTSSPETPRHRIPEVTLATLWCSKARFVMDLWIASFASMFQSMFASMFDRVGTNVGTNLVPLFDSFFDLRFSIDLDFFIETSEPDQFRDHFGSVF